MKWWKKQRCVSRLFSSVCLNYVEIDIPTLKEDFFLCMNKIQKGHLKIY